MTQEILPFPEWRVPAWAVRCFEVANAAGDYWRNAFFYGFKDEFLERHAVPDGWDLQVLTNYCYSCEGTGLWHGRDYCESCFGTGIYSKRKIILWRFRLGDSVFHLPDWRSTTLDVEKLLANGKLPTEIFTKRIEHAPRGWWKGILAALALFVRYDGPRARRFLRYVLANAPSHFPPTRWLNWKISQVKWRCQRVYYRWKYGPEQEEVPF